MNVKNSLKLWAAVFVLALPLLLISTANAKYMSDGAVSDPTGTAGFILPTDGICVLSIDMSGNVVTDPAITNKRDCDARLVDVTAVTPGDTLANVCTKTVKNTAGVKYAAPGSSTCVTVDGSGYISGSVSMKDLDKNAQMCTAKGGNYLANNAAVKTTANGTAAKCLAYGWQYRGQDTVGAPKDLSSGAGFCYASMRTTTAAASCPTVLGSTSGTANSDSSTAFGYSVSGSFCLYAYGINGPVNAALTKADGTTYAAGTTVDLSAFTTLGTCLANGGSWANWMPKNGTASGNGLTSYATFDFVNQAVNADEGCLHCHSTKVQQNGPTERWKDSYLKTGHKNMLRKVTAGQLLVGADGMPYTTDGTNTIDMAAGTINVSGVDHNLRYIWGDWMAPLPTVAYDGGSTYGCGACHTAGFKDNTNPGVQSIGTPGYTPAEPAKSGAAYVAAVTAGHKWDLEGIQCSRCHNAAYPQVSQAQINASAFPTTAPVGQNGMGTLAAGTGRNNLCFGCHQSIAKNWPAQGGAATGTTQYSPTLIPTGINHGASVGRDFNGHVLGNSFLNSVHARYAGVNSNSANGGIKLNALGKFDLFDTSGTVEYNSTFKGYTCWQSPTTNSPAKTKADGTEIKTKAECEAIYGVGSWRADQDGSLAATSVQGTCTTCHDVHNSLFVPSQAEAALRKTCEGCHVNNAATGASDATKTPQVATFNHPAGANTPFDATKYESSCVVCHMASQAKENGDQVSMPVHVWRINTDASYNTFPTADQWDGLNGATKDRNAQVAPETYVKADGTIATYANAVWVDLDLACGQCHGGSLGTSATHNAAPYFTKAQLSGYASNMHNTHQTASFTWKADAGVDYQINLTSTSTCNGSCTSTWTFGDGTTAAGTTASKVYSSTTPTTVTLTVTQGSVVETASASVTPQYVAATPTSLPGGLTVTPTGLSATAQWTVAGGVAPYTVRVNWGNGTTTPVTQPAAGPGTLSNSYVTAGTYTVSVYAIDSGVNGGNQTSATASTTVTTVASSVTVSGTVTRLGGVTPVSGASVVLKLNGVVKKLAYTDASGNYSIAGVASGTYTVTVAKSGVTFAIPAATITVGSSPVTQNISSLN